MAASLASARRDLACGMLALWIAACGSIPDDRKDYIGTWEGDGFYLWISATGSVEYERQQGSRSTSLSGPLKEFVGDDFEVGFLFLTSTFKVAQRPHRTGPYWTMVVDGVPLIKVAGPGAVRAPDEVPDDGELRRLAAAAVDTFAAAVRAGDLAVLHRSMSVLWQIRNSVEDLELFSGHHLRGNADFSQVTKFNPVFDEVYIDDEGFLWMKGHYPAKPSTINFGFHFAYEPPAWALYGFHLTAE